MNWLKGQLGRERDTGAHRAGDVRDPGRMAPDVRDLRTARRPQVVAKKVSTKVRDSDTGGPLPARAGASSTPPSGRRTLVGEAGRKRNPAALTDAVKSDPRPLVLLAIALAVTLMTARKISNGRGSRTRRPPRARPGRPSDS